MNDVPAKVEKVSKAPTKPTKAWFIEALKSDKITPEHVTQVLGVVGKIADAKIQAGLVELETTQRIRELMAAVESDTKRASRAADLFDTFLPLLTDEEKSNLAALIIRAQLGAIGDGK